MIPIKVFIGHDHNEEIAYHVLASSIIRRASVPVSITPIAVHNFKSFYNRQKAENESTKFSIARFLVPYLCDYKDWAIFIDCDMIMKCDIGELFAYRHPNVCNSVAVCQHNYTPKTDSKFLGNTQYLYPKKNWSSVMLFNNAKCTKLTPEYVEKASGAQLHQFEWADGVGSIPLEYNWLVDEYSHNDDAKILHYTLGGPYFDDYVTCDHRSDWWDECQFMEYVRHGYE